MMELEVRHYKGLPTFLKSAENIYHILLCVLYLLFSQNLVPPKSLHACGCEILVLARSRRIHELL